MPASIGRHARRMYRVVGHGVYCALPYRGACLSDRHHFMTIPNRDVPDRDTSAGADVERALVDRVRASDMAAFEQIFQLYNRQLYRFAFRLLRNSDDAEDAVQGVFVAIWDGRTTWLIQSSLRVYLFTAVRNRAFRQLRNAQTRNRLQSDVLAFKSRFRGEISLAPDAHVQHQDFAAAIEHAVAAMPSRMREAFLLNRDHGMTYSQVAATMGTSVKTVTTQISRALAVLRKAAAPFLTVFLTLR